MASLPNAIDRKGRAPSQLQALIGLLPNAVVKMGGRAPGSHKPEYRVHSSVASSREIEYRLYPPTMMLLDNIDHNVHVI